MEIYGISSGRSKLPVHPFPFSKLKCHSENALQTIIMHHLCTELQIYSKYINATSFRHSFTRIFLLNFERCFLCCQYFLSPLIRVLYKYVALLLFVIRVKSLSYPSYFIVCSRFRAQCNTNAMNTS